MATTEEKERHIRFQTETTDHTKSQLKDGKYKATSEEDCCSGGECSTYAIPKALAKEETYYKKSRHKCKFDQSSKKSDMSTRDKEIHNDTTTNIKQVPLLCCTNKSNKDIVSRLPKHSSESMPVKANHWFGGCRPKQKLPPTVVSAPCKINTNGNTDNCDSNGIKYLESILEKDPNTLTVELSQSASLLCRYISKAAKDEMTLVTLLQVISKAFMSRSTPNEMIRLFEIIKKNGFFQTLEKYLVDLLIQIGNGNVNKPVLQSVIRYTMRIGVEQLTRNPSSAYVFRKLQALLGQIIDDLAETDPVDDDITTEYQQFAEEIKRNDREQKKSNIHVEYPKPTDDFRQYQIAPTPEEITGRKKPCIRPNKIDGPYDDLQDYLDIHFRLLREDLVRPLREGMAQYINLKTLNKENPISPKLLDLKIYENVRVHSPVVTNHGLCFKLQLQMTPSLRKIEWKFSKRLIYGSLVCLTNTQFTEFLLATVVEREDRYIKHGLFTVHFEGQGICTADIINKVYRMAETPGYFESYKHVLASLQSFHEGDLPFEHYIVGCHKDHRPPRYLGPGTAYDFKPLINQHMEIKDIPMIVHRDVHVLDTNSWPSTEQLQMDKSQYSAVQNALTNEFVIIQGPPGTGKTYIGLKIVKALLHNKTVWKGPRLTNRPMLVVCYTNHALDQFLEGILKFYKGTVIRVGGRSNSNVLQEHNLKEHRKVKYKKGTTLARLKYEKWLARDMMDFLSKSAQRSANTLQLFKTELIHEDTIITEMGALYDDLTSKHRSQKMQDERHSCIVEWLGIQEMKAECLKQVQKGKRSKSIKHIKVETDASHMEENRMIDKIEELIYSNSTHIYLKSIRREVAFSVPELSRNQKVDYIQRDYTKLLKSNLMENIADQDIMAEEEMNKVKGVWRLKRKDRWRLYRYWIQQACQRLYEEMEKSRERFEDASKDYVEAEKAFDKEIMKKASILGMTTSGAARYQSVLQDIGPKIIIVEEAAEVLEAHIITTLSKECEQLILIGDHKQLRPSPTVYELAIKYNLDVSLFERMVNNGLHFSCLELQHRMRPEISSIMRYIYPDLKDHEHVESYPNVKGISANFFLINHTHPEYSNQDIKSYSNENEAKYAVALCKYLLLQGYGEHEITILTTYTGQLKCLKNLMPKKDFEGVKVTSVDNYQGEENEIIILSLVRSNAIGKIGFLKINNRICVALSRAKIGFFLLGNFDHLSGHSDLWKNIVEDMKKKNLFGEGLHLYCQNHPTDNAILAKSHKDFDHAPEGGCRKKCDIRLKCGHRCERFCHVTDQEHETEKSRCKKPCIKSCENGHTCQALCYRNCPSCPVLLNRTMPKCGHMQMVACGLNIEEVICTTPCEVMLSCTHRCQNVCREEHTIKCLKPCTKSCKNGHKCQALCYKKCPPCPVLLNRTIPKCGHMQPIACGLNIEEITCKMTYEVKLPCSHPCQNVCGEEHTTKCLIKINRKWPCGHTSDIRCFEKDTMLCPHSCTSKLECGDICSGTCGSCTMGRVHQPCQREIVKRLVCGHTVECFCRDTPICTEFCSNKCEHTKCLKRCWEICKPCRLPCVWRCEHYRCDKLCSEICDRPRCNKPCRKVLKCKHTCIGYCGEPCISLCRKCDKKKLRDLTYGEVNKPNARFVLLQDCNHLVESDVLDEYMVKINTPNFKRLPICPLCQTQIKRCRRYRQILQEISKRVESEKKYPYAKIILKYRFANKIDETLVDNGDISTICLDIELGNITPKEALAKYPCHYFKVLCRREFTKRIKDSSVRVTTHALATMQIQYRIAMKIIELQQQLTPYVKDGIKWKSTAEGYLITLLYELLKNILKPREKMSEQEISDFDREINRGKIFIEYMKIKPTLRLTEGVKNPNRDVMKIQSLILGKPKLTNINVREIKQCFGRIRRMPVNDRPNGSDKGIRNIIVGTERQSVTGCLCVRRRHDDKDENALKYGCCVGLEFGTDVEFVPLIANRQRRNNVSDIESLEGLPVDGNVDKNKISVDETTILNMCENGACVCCVDDVEFGFNHTFQ